MATKSYFGRNSFVGVAEESSYGSATATPTVTRPIISCSMLRAVEKVERANLRVAGVAGLRKGHYLVADRASGSLELEATYDNIGYFLKQALGASSTASATLETHTYTMGDVPIAGTTLRLQRGTDDNSETFEGVVFNTFVASVAAGEAMTISMDMIAETSADPTSAAARGAHSLAFSNPTNEGLVLHHHAGNLVWNGQSINLIDFEYNLQNGLADRMRLGSLVTKQPVQSDYRTATMTVTFETDDATYASMISDAVSDASVTFNNNLSSTNEREMKFELNNAYIESFTDEVSETGLITASMTLKAQGDGTSGINLGTMITVKNKTTAVGNG